MLASFHVLWWFLFTLNTHDMKCIDLMLFSGKTLDSHDMRNKCISLIFIYSYSCISLHPSSLSFIVHLQFRMTFSEPGWIAFWITFCFLDLSNEMWQVAVLSTVTTWIPLTPMLIFALLSTLTTWAVTATAINLRDIETFETLHMNPIDCNADLLYTSNTH